MLEALLATFALVAASEMGDKTQILAFSLATRYRKPGAVLAGIAVSTVALNLLASTIGVWLASRVPPRGLALAIAALFLGFGIWTLRGQDEEQASAGSASSRGAFLTTAGLFFVAELGDKTQVAAVALAAQYHSVVAVTTGATLGMLVADGLAVLLGERLAGRIPMRRVRQGTAALFIAFAAIALYRALAG